MAGKIKKVAGGRTFHPPVQVQQQAPAKAEAPAQPAVTDAELEARGLVPEDVLLLGDLRFIMAVSGRVPLAGPELDRLAQVRRMLARWIECDPRGVVVSPLGTTSVEQPEAEPEHEAALA